MWLELFVVGTFWFWALLALELIFLAAFVHFENGVAATASLIILAFALMLFGDFNVFIYVIDNPSILWKYVLTYFIIGTVWSVIRWYWLNRKVRMVFDEAKEDFMEKRGFQSNIPAEAKGDWRDYLESIREWPRSYRKPYSIDSLKKLIPSPREYKARISFWISYWPISVLWVALHDLIEEIGQWFYLQLRKLFESISKLVFKGISDDLT